MTIFTKETSTGTFLELPCAYADYGLRGDFQAFLRADLGDVVHPGMRVLKRQNSPSEGASHDPVKTAAHGNAWAVLCSFD